MFKLTVYKLGGYDQAIWEEEHYSKIFNSHEKAKKAAEKWAAGWNDNQTLWIEKIEVAAL